MQSAKTLAFLATRNNALGHSAKRKLEKIYINGPETLASTKQTFERTLNLLFHGNKLSHRMPVLLFIAGAGQASQEDKNAIIKLIKVHPEIRALLALNGADVVNDFWSDNHRMDHIKALRGVSVSE